MAQILRETLRVAALTHSDERVCVAGGGNAHGVAVLDGHFNVAVFATQREPGDRKAPRGISLTAGDLHVQAGSEPASSDVHARVAGGTGNFGTQDALAGVAV